MLDWLSTKVAMTLAALLLLAGAVGFFTLQRAQIAHDALQDVATRAASYIEEVSGSEGELATTMSLGAGGALDLPALAAGQRYTLEIHRAHLVAIAGGDRAAAVLTVPIHLWEPHAGNYTEESVADLDAANTVLTIASGGSVVVSARIIEIDGVPRLATFLFP